MIEIILTCTECGQKSEPYEGTPIDTYSWHDAPVEAVETDNQPAGWWVFDHRYGIVLCPKHSSVSNIKEHRKRAWAK